MRRSANSIRLPNIKHYAVKNPKDPPTLAEVAAKWQGDQKPSSNGSMCYLVTELKHYAKHERLAYEDDLLTKVLNDSVAAGFGSGGWRLKDRDFTLAPTKPIKLRIGRRNNIEIIDNEVLLSIAQDIASKYPRSTYERMRIPISIEFVYDIPAADGTTRTRRRSKRRERRKQHIRRLKGK